MTELEILTAVLIAAKGEEAGKGIAKAVTELSGDPVARMRKVLEGQGIPVPVIATPAPINGGLPIASVGHESGAGAAPAAPGHRARGLVKELDAAAEHARRHGYRVTVLRVWTALLRHAHRDPHRWARIGARRLEAEAGVGLRARRSALKRLAADGYITQGFSGEGRWVGGRRATGQWKLPPPPPLPNLE